MWKVFNSFTDLREIDLSFLINQVYYNPYIQDNEGHNPLHLAIISNKKQVRVNLIRGMHIEVNYKSMIH